MSTRNFSWRLTGSKPALCGFLAAMATGRAIPPLNDAFSTRSLLTLAGVSGSNVEATVEPGEPEQTRGAPGCATVWWTFTPPVSGWYEISTGGSAVDTVLAVYTNDSLSNLVRVATADDDALDGSVNTSRVRFQGTESTPYAVQVGGFSEAAQGLFTLSVQAVSPPSDRVTTASFGPAAPYDTGSADAVVTISFGIVQSANFNSGTVFVARPDGVVLASRPFSAADRISGTAIAGTYNVNLTVPRYAAPGNYPVWITAASVGGEFQAGSWMWTSFPADTASFLPVTNSGTVDTSAPLLSSAGLNQSSIDVTSAGVVVPLTLDIADDLSGFSSASVSLEQVLSPSLNATLASTTVTGAHRTSGTALAGRYQLQFYIPQDAPAGVWSLRCELRDALGNASVVNPPATLTVNKIPFTAWAIAHGLTGPAALPDADPDNDGQSNVEEFSFHTDPKRGSFKTVSATTPDRVYLFQGALPLQYSAGGQLHLRFLRRRGMNAGTATAVAQFASDLPGWSAAADVTVSPFSAEWEMVDARDSVSFDAVNRRFGRVLVTMP